MDNLQEIKIFLENMEFNNQKQFLKLLLKHSIPFTENKNGTFLNINELSSSHISLILQFISLIEEEEQNFNKIENTKSTLKKLINTTQDPPTPLYSYK